MAGKAEQIRGRAEEAVGDLTGSKDRKAVGTADRQAGMAKEEVARVEKTVDETIDKLKSRLHKNERGIPGGQE